ncbi:MAG: PDZ domain-containing protein [Halobacteriovoraceae bacterium]|nr:PDZ domain-containing protein [Halobacteriovoraceae bacterium]MCB9093871.1 PDZ domain-containing protein [Halobacteriovoraceae bacterium]
MRHAVLSVRILVFISFFQIGSGFSQDQEIINPWIQTGIDLQDFKSLFIENNLCDSQPYFDYCLDTILQMYAIAFTMSESGVIMLPTEDVPSFLEDVVKNDDLLQIYNELGFIAEIDEEKFYEKTKDNPEKGRFDLLRDVVEYWKVKIYSNQIKPIDFNRYYNGLLPIFGDESSSASAGAFAIENMFKWIYDDQSQLELRKAWSFDPFYFGMQNKNVSENAYIGIHFSIKKDAKGNFVVIAVAPQSQAKKIGIQELDIIKAVNGVNIEKLSSVEELWKHFNFSLGESNDIKILRGSDTLNFTVENEEFRESEVSTYYYKNDEILYIKLNSFMHEYSESKIKNSILAAESVGAKKIILDLRGNPGGLVSLAEKIAEIFLGKKRKIFKSLNLGETELIEHKTEESKFTKLPLVVLVDHNSASCSELLAQALADNKRAILVGRETFGKGTIQSSVSLKRYLEDYDFHASVTGAAGLHYTTKIFTGPKGKSNHLQGVIPHFDVKQRGYFAPSTELRIKDVSRKWTPVAGYKQPIYKTSNRLKNCVEKTGIADKRLNSMAINGSLDYQRLFAIDVVNCLTN